MDKMKKIKFSFINNNEPEISEIFEFDEATLQVIINDTFTEWFFDELDRQGIEGYYEEVD